MNKLTIGMIVDRFRCIQIKYREHYFCLDYSALATESLSIWAYKDRNIETSAKIEIAHIHFDNRDQDFDCVYEVLGEILENGIEVMNEYADVSNSILDKYDR